MRVQLTPPLVLTIQNISRMESMLKDSNSVGLEIEACFPNKRCLHDFYET